MTTRSFRAPLLVLGLVGLALVLWLALRGGQADTVVATPEPAAAGATMAAPPKPDPASPAATPPTAQDQAAALLMEIPRDLPPLMVPGGATSVVAEEITDVEYRKEVYGASVPAVVGCIAASGTDHKTLDQAFRARLVLAPGGAGTEVRDVVFLADDTAPPALVKCFRDALMRVQLPGSERTGVVTTPPLGGERPKPAVDAAP